MRGLRRSCAGAVAVRAGGDAAAGRAALHLCRSSAERAGRELASEAPRRRAGASAIRRCCWCCRAAARAKSAAWRACSVTRWRWLAEARGRAGGGGARGAAAGRHGAGGGCVLARPGAGGDRAGRKGCGLPHGAGRADQVRHLDARTGARRRADGRRLQGAAAGGIDRPPADQGSKPYPCQSGSGRERGAGTSATRLYARAAGRRAGAAIERYAGAPPADRGLRPARCDHGNRQGRAQRPRRRRGAGLRRRPQPTATRNSGIRARQQRSLPRFARWAYAMAVNWTHRL